MLQKDAKREHNECVMAEHLTSINPNSKADEVTQALRRRRRSDGQERKRKGSSRPPDGTAVHTRERKVATLHLHSSFILTPFGPLPNHHLFLTEPWSSLSNVTLSPSLFFPSTRPLAPPNRIIRITTKMSATPSTSSQPQRILSNRDADTLMKQQKAKALKECREQMESFVECSKTRTISMLWSCRDQKQALSDCLRV